MAKSTPCGPHPPHTLWAFSTPNHRSHYHLHQACARSPASYRIPLFQDGFRNRSSSGNKINGDHGVDERGDQDRNRKVAFIPLGQQGSGRQREDSVMEQVKPDRQQEPRDGMFHVNPAPRARSRGSPPAFSRFRKGPAACGSDYPAAAPPPCPAASPEDGLRLLSAK